MGSRFLTWYTPAWPSATPVRHRIHKEGLELTQIRSSVPAPYRFRVFKDAVQGASLVGSHRAAEGVLGISSLQL